MKRDVGFDKFWDVAEVWNSLIAVTSYGAAKSLMGFITDWGYWAPWGLR